MSYFGRTGAKQRPRIRKFHAELLYAKFRNRERIVTAQEIDRPEDYIHRMVHFSKGFITFSNEERLEMQLTDLFYDKMREWSQRYNKVEDLDHSDENLEKQGIILDDDLIHFDSNLTYARFYKIISDEGESMNDPREWAFNDTGVEKFDHIDFSDKNNPLFSSKLVVLKFFLMRKIDEVAFVTSRYVHCPNCGANYAIPSAKIDFVQTYKCENMLELGKPCGTTLKKFPARKMIPTYIYEAAFEVKTKHGIEYKEYFVESFVEMTPGFYSGMVFGRTENKSNTFYFTCLVAKKEESKYYFNVADYGHKHQLLNVVDSLFDYAKKVGFILDNKKARLVFIVETMKRLTVLFNKEINLGHSLYFGAPGIGKTHGLNLLHHMFYSNSGFISGPRFSLPGLTGGQKEVYYQDTSKKKNVPGLFSMPAFIFDEINNDQFLADDKAVNLVKSTALMPLGTSSTVGGKEFQRISLIAGTGNYDIKYLKRYENTVKKIFQTENAVIDKPKSQESVLMNWDIEESTAMDTGIPEEFDFYAPAKDFKFDTPKNLRVAIARTREGDKNYLTNFPKPLMERFYWSVLVHPKYDKMFMKKKDIDSLEYLKARESEYSLREKITQLYISDFDQMFMERTQAVREKFQDKEIEKAWAQEATKFINALANKYPEFMSMFKRIEEVHVFTLYMLTLINDETELSIETKRLFEKIISLLHTPIDIKDFNDPDFEDFCYLNESPKELLKWIEEHRFEDIRQFVDFDNRRIVRKNLVDLENSGKIIKEKEYCYGINAENDMREENDNQED